MLSRLLTLVLLRWDATPEAVAAVAIVVAAVIVAAVAVVVVSLLRTQPLLADQDGNTINSISSDPDYTLRTAEPRRALQVLSHFILMSSQ